jgi:hypothetical protein
MKNGKFAKAFNVQPYDWCALMSRTAKKISPFMKLAIDSVRKISPEYFHPCPHYGVMTLQNITALRQLVIFLPNGLYRIDNTITDKNNNLIWEYIFDFELS